jgi:hypothetical protein
VTRGWNDRGVDDTHDTGRPAPFLLCALATWRITHLLVEEDGPADAVLRLRVAAGAGPLGRLMDCFYCMSAWVAIPFAAELTGRRSISSAGVVAWLALSGAACLLEQATRREPPPAIEAGA